MKPQPISFRLKIVPVLLLLCFSGVAQERQDTTANPDSALRIINGISAPFDIPGGRGSTSNFKRIESWKPSSKDARVDSLIFKIDREGDIVIAHLSVKLENDKEVIVDTYRLNRDETIKTEALTKFGVEPLVLSVVKAKPPFKDPLPPILPKVENKTKAVEVVSFYQPGPPFDDAFQLSLRNGSNKAITALDLFMASADGNSGDGQRMQGVKDHPVMLPGGTCVAYITVSRGGRMTENGYVPDVALQRTLTIRTVLFDDGTYDGLVEPAAEMEARRKGLDIQRRRILRLLQEAGQTNDGNVFTLDEFKEQVYALSKAANSSVALELIARFPSLDEKSKRSLVRSVEGGLGDGKRELLFYINQFEEMQKQPGEHPSFAEWIKQTQANYEKLTAP